MTGEISQITAHLSNNAMDFFKGCSQFYKLSSELAFFVKITLRHRSL